MQLKKIICTANICLPEMPRQVNEVKIGEYLSLEIDDIGCL